MKFPLFLLYLIFLIPALTSSGQYYDTGQDPASIKWMQIKTGRFTVIYPEKYAAGGIAFAQSLDEAYSDLTALFPEMKFKIPVVIHNYSTRSNGYVAWAPKRMEIYPTPEQNTIPLDPNRQLATHELAHVFQMESLNHGFSKAMSLLLGEQFTGLASSMLPLWFLEGDAVFAESWLTPSGRGRTPSFQKQLKALTVGKGRIYKYDKILNGSFRDYVPDHYQSGYQMVTWSLANYNSQILNKVLKFTAEQPFSLNPVNISLSKSAGLSKKKLYTETFDTLKTLWTNDVKNDDAIQYRSINPEKNGRFINYYSPVYAGTDSVIAVKTSLSAPPAFVLINPTEKTEKKIHIPGPVYPWFISYAKGKVVWVETESDLRWENRDFSVIKILDLANSHTRRLSHKSRYLSASLSPDGKTVCTIENTINNTNRVVFIDSETGIVLQTITAPENSHLQRPQWAEDGGKITVIFLSGKGEGIMSYSPSGQKWEMLIEAGNDDLQSSQLRNDSLFFISSVSGTDNIYLRTPDSEVRRLTRSMFGTSDLCISGDNIIFSDYTSGGNVISTLKTSTSGASGIFHKSSSSFLINRVDIPGQTSVSNTGKVYTPEPYRKWQHPIRFHSWMPFYADLEEIKSDPTLIRPGISVMSQNTLSTIISTIGYEYSGDKNHILHSRVTWQGWYPVIESQLDYGRDPIIYNIGSDGKPRNSPSEIHSGLRFSNTIYLPFSFSSGRFSEYLRTSFTSEYKNDYILTGEAYDYGQTILTGRLYFSNYHRSAMRNIYPRWAQTIDLSYSFAPADRLIYGSAVSLRTSFYMPGILPDNGIKFRFEKEKQDPVKFLMGNRISFPRGYNNLRSKEFEFLSVDYVLPLAYPDLSLSSLLYIKRIRCGFFYDQATGPGNSFYEATSTGITQVTNSADKKRFRSFGFELLADFHILRIPYMISGGIQSAWKNTADKPTIGLLFNIDLFGMTLGRNRL